MRGFFFFSCLFMILVACGNGGGEGDDPCENVNCSGHGSCAVAGGDTAVCLCDPGYHAEAEACVENVAGDECAGVSCSGHGRCVVVRDDPAYPVCICDEGFHNEGDTTCAADQGGALCGEGTHLEDGLCVPDDSERPENFCVPELRDPPGRVVVDSGMVFGLEPSLVWTGSQFLAVYEKEGLKVRTLSVDGAVGEAQDHGDYTKSISSRVVFGSSHAALLAADGGGALHLLIIDETGTGLTAAAVTGEPHDVIPFGDGFALLHDVSIVPVAVDGTMGDEVQLAAEGMQVSAAHDPGAERLGYAFHQGGRCGSFSFSTADADGFDTLSTDPLPTSGDGYGLGWGNPYVLFGGDFYALLADLSLYDDCETTVAFPRALDTFLKLYESDGTPRTGGVSLGFNSQFLHHFVWTGRYFVLLTALSRGACPFWIIDGAGNIYKEGFLARSFALDEESHDAAAVAAYSDSGVGFLYRRTRDIMDTEIVFATFACTE
jgi:hypothetical protein